MADISQIKLPSGTTYDIKDTVARSLVTNNGTFVIAWNGTGTPDASKIPAGVVVTYTSGSTTASITGSLVASDGSGNIENSTLKKFYLVKSATQVNNQDIYDEYITVDNGSSANPRYTWEKIGDTQIALSEIVTGVTPQTSKLVTTTVTGVTGSTTASRVSAGTTQTTATGAGTASSTNTDWLKGVSVSNEILTIGAATLNTQDTTQISIDVPSVTVPIADNSATTVATGSLNANGTGDTVVTGLTVQ